MDASHLDLAHSQLVWGLGAGLFIGLICVGWTATRLWSARGEARRLRRHLIEKFELETEATNRLRADLQEYRQQNENLRLKIAVLNQPAERRLQRELRSTPGRKE